ncbi:PP0621 family protein [Janthinobacterium sp. 17J80-10]|uniref:PP0621 family protein n=1 Tax=Janthinobacterium sp. 17J80-10 TaxID=2497863 RepID=UPI00100549F3|nr:PP0621 family protein [Janthinobacterium sp. 17J80-10]QAU33517.1 hypothetical protein EKL02_04585 [Janthinobacterium sp. 17J80-10]
MKLLIWLVIVALVVAWIMRSKKAPVQNEGGIRQSQDVGGHLKPEAMLQCARCGTYFPASEAVTLASGRVFCSEEHRRQAVPGD